MIESAEHIEIVSADGNEDTGWTNLVWLAVGVVSFGLCAAVVYEPSFEDGRSTALTVLPPLVLVAMSAVFLYPRLELPPTAQMVARVVAIGGWSVLMFDDDRWMLLTFALYAVSYGARQRVGISLAAAVSVSWAAAWLAADAPAWTVAIPLGVFIVSAMLSFTIGRAVELNESQADLIRQLTETRRDLALSERAAGILDERARFAGEIHDTLAQGFTSIVLLSRAAQRGGDAAGGLVQIEQTAQENLDAARRLVDAIGPVELESGSLPDALERQRTTALPPEISSELRIVGRPHQLAGATEVTLLRAAQEALLNVRSHSGAETVDITLSYLGDVVALDVRDDGVGFTPGAVDDRGSLTGGQGLQVLERRVRSLDGEFNIEAIDGGGTVVSVLLPSPSPARLNPASPDSQTVISSPAAGSADTAAADAPFDSSAARS